MIESFVLVIALLVIPVILLFANAGCTGEDAILTAQAKQKEAEDHSKDIENQAAAAAAAAKAAAEAAKYHNRVGNNTHLVSYWRLGEIETGDPTAFDSVPNNKLHGEYKNLQGVSRGETGALAPSPDPDDKAAEFLGTQSYVEVPYSGLRNPPLAFSIEFWIKPTTSTSTDPKVIIGSYELDAVGNVVRGSVIDLLRVPTLRVRARLGSGSAVTTLEASLGDGSEHDGWRHVVVTYNGATKALMIYVNADDGKADAQLPSPSAPAPVAYQAIADTSMPLRIAAGQPETAALPGPGSAVTGFLAARLDEVALYRVAIDGTTVREHFHAGSV